MGEQQLRNRHRISRILMTFGVADDKKIHTTIEKDFLAWRDKEGLKESVTGVCFFIAQHAVQLLEGQTEDIFKAIEFFNSMSEEHQLAADKEKDAPPPLVNATGSTFQSAPSTALLTQLRVLHF